MTLRKLKTEHDEAVMASFPMCDCIQQLRARSEEFASGVIVLLSCLAKALVAMNRKLEKSASLPKEMRDAHADRLRFLLATS